MYLFKVSFYFNLSKDFGDRSVSYLNSSPGQQLTLLGWIVDPEKYFIRKYFVDLLKIFCEIFLPRHPAILPAVITTGCLKKNSDVGFVHFSQPLRRARIKVRCALYSSFNGEYFKRLNFTIW